MKKGLIKKGAKHPTSPSYKYTGESYTTKKQAWDEAHRLEDKGKDVKVIVVPRQRLVYAKPVGKKRK